MEDGRKLEVQLGALGRGKGGEEDEDGEEPSSCPLWEPSTCPALCLAPSASPNPFSQQPRKAAVIRQEQQAWFQWLDRSDRGKTSASPVSSAPTATLASVLLLHPTPSSTPTLQDMASFFLEIGSC